jgi:hypothetical protein
MIERDDDIPLDDLYPADLEVGELARLQRVLAEIFTAADCSPVAPGTFNQADWAQVDWDRAVLQLVPTFAQLPLTTNAAAIWSANRDGAPPPPAASLDVPTQLVLWRNGFTPNFRSLDPAEAAALKQVSGGMTFGALCALLVERYGAADGPRLAGAWLGQWLCDGLMARVA